MYLAVENYTFTLLLSKKRSGLIVFPSFFSLSLMEEDESWTIEEPSLGPLSLSFPFHSFIANLNVHCTCPKWFWLLPLIIVLFISIINCWCFSLKKDAFKFLSKCKISEIQKHYTSWMRLENEIPNLWLILPKANDFGRKGKLSFFFPSPF